MPHWTLREIPLSVLKLFWELYIFITYVKQILTNHSMQKSYFYTPKRYIMLTLKHSYKVTDTPRRRRKLLSHAKDPRHTTPIKGGLIFEERLQYIFVPCPCSMGDDADLAESQCAVFFFLYTIDYRNNIWHIQ